ncbi:uncharacterized protein LOC143915584 [Arctopsyche grandis]|uniref:uncharacterized protein LOC143915584 n=1 Tax=Arctopsyche grandis TaxID=121162 RepID=UPI00406D769C
MTTILKCNILILLAIAAALVVAQEQPQKRAIDDDGSRIQLADPIIERDRQTRQSKRPKTTPQPLGFFGSIGTIGRLIYEQYNDTKSAYSQVSELFNGQFSDSGPTTKPPPITDNSTTTTEAPPRLSRAEFLEVLRRNVIGLRRLYNLEMREALADSRKNIVEYKREFNRKLYEQFQDD